MPRLTPNHDSGAQNAAGYRLDAECARDNYPENVRHVGNMVGKDNRCDNQIAKGHERCDDAGHARDALYAAYYDQGEQNGKCQACI